MTDSAKPIRTRFAPSPTGYLHVGGARTALFSWLFARKQGGTFILRIEDTDLERSTEPSVQAILDGMQWMGLDYDEGPYYQTQHFARYQEVINQLLAQGRAYRCYCSKERLTQLRESQMANKQKPRYDGHCRELKEQDQTRSHVIRFANPKEGAVSFDDIVRGCITVQNSELDDLIIARTDGTPTYNLTVVVDDWDMQITHIIRGDDHINNTPRQINILQALEANIPQYGHVPMILGSDGKRLSKRHGAVSVMQYREDGFLPQALRNYLVRLGWSYKDQEIFSLDEMVSLFDVNNIARSPAAFNPEKLEWLNQHYLKTLDPTDIAHAFEEQLKAIGVSIAIGPALEDVIAVQAERCKTLKEMALRSIYFYQDIGLNDYDKKAVSKNLKQEIMPALKEVLNCMQDVVWEKEAIHNIIIDVAEQFELKLGKLAQPIRVAMTGGTISPPIDMTLLLIGRERVLQRLEQVNKLMVSLGSDESGLA